MRMSWSKKTCETVLTNLTLYWKLGELKLGQLDLEQLNLGVQTAEKEVERHQADLNSQKEVIARRDFQVSLVQFKGVEAGLKTTEVELRMVQKELRQAQEELRLANAIQIQLPIIQQRIEDVKAAIARTCSDVIFNLAETTVTTEKENGIKEDASLEERKAALEAIEAINKSEYKGEEYVGSKERAQTLQDAIDEARSKIAKARKNRKKVR